MAAVVIAVLGGLYVVRGAAQWSSRGCNLRSSVVNAVVHGEPGTFEYCDTGPTSYADDDWSPPPEPRRRTTTTTVFIGDPTTCPPSDEWCFDAESLPSESLPSESLPPETISPEATTTTTSYEQSPEGIAETERQAACDASWAAYDRDWAAWSAEYDTWSTQAWAANDAAWAEWDGTGPSPVAPDEDAWRSEHPEPTTPTC